MSWWMIPVIGAMALGVWFLGWRLMRIRTTDHVHCDIRDQDYFVDFERRATPGWNPGRKVDVKSCTAFTNPEQVTCAKACLRIPDAELERQHRAA